MKHFFLPILRNWWLVVCLLLAVEPALAQPTGCSRPDPAGNPAANGLFAEYYAGYFADDQSFFTTRTPGLSRVDAQLDFAATNSFGNIVPPAQNTVNDPQQFSARFRGSILIPADGNYTFYLESDDASYLWLDAAAQAIPAQATAATIRNGGTHGPIEAASQSVFLTAGLHPILIHYGEDLYGNTLILRWRGDGGSGTSPAATFAKQVVPSAALCSSVQTPLGIAQSIRYAPATAGVAAGSAVSSTAPTVDDGGSPVTGFALGNAADLPAGISIDAATGVLTAAGTVPSGTYSVAVAVTNANGTSTFANVFTFNIAPPPPSGCAGTDPGGAAPARGLYGEYYAGFFANNQEFFQNNSAGLQRVDALVNFATNASWGAISPPAGNTGGSLDNFSLRLRGSVYVPVTGRYTFYLTSDDAAYLWVGNAALDAPAQTRRATVNNGGQHPVRTDSATVFLTAGLQNILIHYGEGGGDNVLTLEWRSPAAGLARQLVPSAALCTVVQPFKQVPTAYNYRPNRVVLVSGASGSSAAPSVTSPLPVAGYALLNAPDLPAGISLNATTGVLTADATVAQGRYHADLVVYNADGALERLMAFSFAVTPPPPPGCTGTDPGGAPAAAGLYSEYYSGYFDDDLDRHTYFTRFAPVQSRIEPVTDFMTPATWGDLGGAAEFEDSSPRQPLRFSVRLRGSLYVAVAGTYRFYLTSDDASYLWLGNSALADPTDREAALIDLRGGHPATTKTADVTLAPGLYNIQMQYGQFTGPNALQLEWENLDPAAGVARQLVPSSSFCSSALVVPLPVTLMNFRARPVGNRVELSWETAQELNNHYFELERSADGRTYHSLGRTAGAGNSTARRSYRQLDAQPLPGISYYRLRQVDHDGSATTGPVVAVQRGSAAQAPVVSVYPNPNGGRFALRLQEAAGSGARIELLDLGGRVLHTQALTPGAQEQAVSVTGLAAGVYQLRIISPAGTSTTRVVVQ